MPTHRLTLAVCVFLAALCLDLGALRAENPVLISKPGLARVERGAGASVAIPLAPGAALSSVTPLGEGWIAAGVRATEEGRASDLLLILPGQAKSQGVELNEIVPPSARIGPIRQEPVPLVAGDRLTGLVWLEGQDRGSFAVRFAAWKGQSWGAVQTISRGGSGSQLALTSARLRDGSWLIAWSAFDGKDDEILWSRWNPARGETWSQPRRAAQDNAVPDITPALTVAGDTALLAWSRFDGEGYSTVISRFQGANQGGNWTAPQWVAPAGAVYPTFEPKAGGALLVLRTSAPQGWAAVEIDAAGRIGRKALLPAREANRPVVQAENGPASSVTFRWSATGTERRADWQTEQQP
jgi:hypothetical protein